VLIQVMDKHKGESGAAGASKSSECVIVLDSQEELSKQRHILPIGQPASGQQSSGLIYSSQQHPSGGLQPSSAQQPSRPEQNLIVTVCDDSEQFTGNNILGSLSIKKLYYLRVIYVNSSMFNVIIIRVRTQYYVTVRLWFERSTTLRYDTGMIRVK